MLGRLPHPTLVRRVCCTSMSTLLYQHTCAQALLNPGFNLRSHLKLA